MIPEPVATAIAETIATEGVSATAAGLMHGVSRASGARIANRKADLIARLREAASFRWARKVLRRSETITGALCASAENPESRGQAQAARVLLEGAGLIGGVRDVTINGDVDASVTSVDARTLVVSDPATIAARAKAIRDELGIG